VLASSKVLDAFVVGGEVMGCRGLAKQVSARGSQRTMAGISEGTLTLPVAEVSSMRNVAGPATAVAGTRTESS